MEITFALAHNISSSKGWGRYRASTPAGPLVLSRTGNEWVSAGHSGDVADGTPVAVTLQTMERVGKMRRERIDSYEYSLVAEQGSTADLGWQSGLRVMVEGARLA